MANSPAVAVVDVGTVIDGTYIIEGLLGCGGMGTVFLASHNRLAGKQVAIKMLHVDTSSDEILKRFKTEAEIAARLDQPNIVVVIDYKTLDDTTRRPTSSTSTSRVNRSRSASRRRARSSSSRCSRSSVRWDRP